MSTTEDKIEVDCPQCGRQLLVPASALGKHGRCPSCKHVFPLEVAVAADVVASSPATDDGVDSEAEYQFASAAASPQPFGAASPVPPGAQVDKGKYNHGLGWEHRGWDAGVMGGLGMMALGGIWFGVGLYLGRIFFKPAILFIIGLVGFLRGLFRSDLAGKQPDASAARST